jgi:hypothetical protein
MIQVSDEFRCNSFLSHAIIKYLMQYPDPFVLSLFQSFPSQVTFVEASEFISTATTLMGSKVHARHSHPH